MHRIRLAPAGALLFIAAFSAPAAAQRSPGLDAARRLETFLAGQGDRGVDAFIDQWIDPSLRKELGDEALQKKLVGLREQFRGAGVLGAMPAGANGVQLDFDAAPSGRRSLRFSFSPAPPHRFTAIEFESNEPAAWRSIKANMTDAEMASALDALLEELHARDAFSGAALIARGDEPVYRKAIGEASRRYGVANKPDTKFNLGSMNKMFTGMAICQLAQQGKLNLDDKVGKHLPGYPNSDVREKVTISHLLTHSSGMGSYWNDEYEKRWKYIRTLDDLLPTFVNDPLQFTPGARFGYSNAGPVVLGLIIEKLSGMSYYDYVRENIFKPAGMKNTDSYAVDVPVPNLAIGHTKMIPGSDEPADDWRENILAHSIKGGPAGGGYSTVDDMLRFARAIQEGTLLDAKHTNLYLTGRISMGPGMKYACLIGDDRSSGHRKHGHNGGAPGINADFGFYPELGYTFVVLSNIDGGARGVSRFVREMIESRGPEGQSAGRMRDEPEIESVGTPYRLGVHLAPGPNELVVERVLPNSAAERGGLRAGDRIVGISDAEFVDDPLDALTQRLTSPKAFDVIVDRDGKRLTLSLTPAKAEP